MEHTPTSSKRGRHNAPRPKACLHLGADALAALRARTEATSMSAVARELAVSDVLVRRVLILGEPITPSMHRLLSLQLVPPNDSAATCAA